MKRILVALDGSQRADIVLTAAMRLAELTGAKLILFRAIVVPPELPRELLAINGGHVDDYLKHEARKELDELAKQIPAHMIEAFVTEFATAWDGVCTTARTHDVDLIMLGSHGFHGIDHVLGTTAAKVVNHADRNVLIVRAPL